MAKLEKKINQLLVEELDDPASNDKSREALQKKIEKIRNISKLM
jgi:hypothetical protein